VANTLPETAAKVALAPLAESAGPPLLEFAHVTKVYGPVIGLNEVSLRLEPGVTGLVGPNGAGKSTFMKLATGQLRPTLGRVAILGKDAWTAAAKRHLGYCPDSDNFYEEMSGRRFVLTMARLCGFSRRDARERTEKALMVTGMADRADRKIRGYSKGMRQRIKLAQALVHDPRLIVLDEPFNGVDPVGRIEMQRLFDKLAEQGKSLLISSHQLDELEKLTDRIAVIARGMLVAQGTVTAIRDLMDDQPLTVRIDNDQPRVLAAALLQLPEVLGVELAGGGTLTVRAKQPLQFFRNIAQLVLEEGFEIAHLETLDCSAQAIFDYVVSGGR
jgi:ABC-2 type transport system ATP-binding protein